MKTTVVFLSALALVGCASGDYRQYVAAQNAAVAQAYANQRPLFKLTAQPGQAITGVASIEVNLPVQAPTLQQARPNEWAGVLGSGINVAGAVLGIKYAGDAATNLATAVGGAANHGYQYVQAPQPNQTVGTGFIGNLYSDGNSGVIGSGVKSDATHTPTVVEQAPPIVVTQPPPLVVDPVVVDPVVVSPVVIEPAP
jgi:hypothetical protein